MSTKTLASFMNKSITFSDILNLIYSTFSEQDKQQKTLANSIFTRV
jgi:hypothetical protein